MFVGREKELRDLDKMYHSDKFEFAVIYGRRRVGKTALISHFIQDKKAIYFMGVESNEKQNLENFSKSIFEYAEGVQSGLVFDSFQTALEYVFQLAQKERIIIAVDEYPYVARVSKGLASTLQMLIDKYKDNSKLMLIICGSSMSYIEDHVLAYKAPLYGRRTAQMKILPFDFAGDLPLFNNFSDEDKAIIYGIVGGTPQYLLQMDDKLSIGENIRNTFLNTSSFLFEETENLLKQEVRDTAIYNAIITSIATGASRMSEISAKIGENTSVCSNYLKNLISLGIIKKEIPYGEKSSRNLFIELRIICSVSGIDLFPANTSIIMRGAVDLAYRRIEPQLSDYMGSVFEDICGQYLWKLLINGESPVEFAELGRWWGNDPVSRSQTEIDIMAVQDRNTALFGECKWTNEKVDLGVLEILVKRSQIFHYNNTRLYLFAKNGFTKGWQEEAEKLGNVSLVTFQDIMDYICA